MAVMSVKRASEAAESAPTYRVEGYATTFNDPYLLMQDGDEKLYEQIDSRAFDGCDMSDVIMQYDHEGRVFARTSNGTLTLTVDEHGLKVEADLSTTSTARAMWEDINAGLVTRMSFAFTVDAHEFDPESSTDTITAIGKLYDVSAVSIPANPGTDISARSATFFNGVIEEKRAERLAAQKRAQKIKLLRTRAKLTEVMNHV